MTRRPHIVAAALLAAAACGLLAGPPPAGAALPLGPPSLPERRSATIVAPGLRLVRIVRGGAGGGPWHVYVLEVDRARLAGRLTAVLAHERVPGLERTTSMASRKQALAGVNGGYFAPRLPDTGDPVGVLAVGGRLVSESVGARTALLIPRSRTAPARVEALRFRGTVALGARQRLVDGVDRRRGRIPGCGGIGGDRPTDLPNPFVTCTDPSELVVLSPRFGERTATGPAGWEAIVRRGVVTVLRRGGNSPIPRDGYVLSGSGDAASFLRAGARPGMRPAVDLALRTPRGTVHAADFEAITGGGPRLLRGGRVEVTARLEGLTSLARRGPRTLAGVRGDGRVLLVAIDGRRPGWSLGASLRESAAVMRSLGAREALSLDGGGSTAMALGPRLVNRPSDPGGERPVSDGLFIVP